MSENTQTQLLDDAITAGAASAPDTAPARVRDTAEIVSAWALPIALGAVILLGFIVSPSFRSINNFRAILLTASLVGIVAVGMTPITLSGNFISLAASQSTMVASVTFLSVFNIGVGWGMNLALWTVISFLITLVVAAILGAAQGVVVASGLNPVVTTLAAGAVMFGVMTIIIGPEVVKSEELGMDWLSGRFLGIPWAVYLFALVTLVWTVIISATKIGRETMLVGSNRRTAALSGVQASRVAILAFVSFGLASALGGMLSAARLHQATTADFTIPDLTIDVVAAVLVGGTAITGGRGSPWRSAVGAIIVATATNIMLLLDFSTGARFFYVGLLVTAVVAGMQWLYSRGTT